MRQIPVVVMGEIFETRKQRRKRRRLSERRWYIH